MVMSGFRRSISMPKPSRPSTAAAEKSLHVRSTSLPNRFHPVTAQLKHHLHALSAWMNSDAAADRSSSEWLLAGLNRLTLLHYSLDDFLNLPQSRQSLLRRRSSSSDINLLLDRFLRFADAFGIFRTALVALREETRATQVGIRSSRRGGRREEYSVSGVDAYVKCRRRLNKEVLPLLGVVREIAKKATSTPTAPEVVNVTTNEEDVQEEETEVEGIVREVSLATVGVSAAVFGAVVGYYCSSSSSFMAGLGSSLMVRLGLIRRKRDGERTLVMREMEEACGEELRKLMKREEKTALKRLEVLENCLAEFERGSERVFRSLIATRVSLLNVFTQ